MPTETDWNLAQGIRVLVTKLNRRLRKQVNIPGQLSMSEENVIKILNGRDYVLPGELCSQLSVSSQLMSQVLNRLEKLDYIQRTPSVVDKRKTEVALTAAGRRMIATTRQEREEWLAGIIEGNYSEAEKEVLLQAVGLLGRLAEL